MDILTHQTWARAIKPEPDLNIWQWCAENVDFALSPNYDTPKHERFDPAFMPFWNEPAEAITDPTIREITILKCARAGGSENILLNPIRYCVATSPQPILYVTGDQISAERFMEKRIKRGFKACPSAHRHYKQAQATQHDIAFPGCDLRVTWPKARQAFKQDGWALVLCDEVSLWPDFSPDMARKRTASYPFSHIVFLSSPDPQQKRGSDDDPIFIEYERGDQRKWYCKDPKTGNEFVFRMGGKDGDGLRWDGTARRDDGTWDLDRVRDSAHYITPDGTRIENSERMTIVRGGRWVVTAGNPRADCRSYHVTAFMTPFKSGDFGAIAASFLQAKRQGTTALRTFIYETLAEKWAHAVERADDELTERKKPYSVGGYLTEGIAPYVGQAGNVVIGGDSQKAFFPFVVREFIGNDSGLIECGNAPDLEMIAAVADKHHAVRVGIDANYVNRRLEVLQACQRHGFAPIIGHDALTASIVETEVDPFEGVPGQGQNGKIGLLKIDVNVFRSMLLDMLRGESFRKWWIPQNAPMDYIRQVVSTQKKDGKWCVRPGYAADHFFDCETYALAMAVYSGILSTA